MIRLPPIGFWSYVRRDDELFRGKVSELRALILAELELQLGQEVPVFKDTVSIPHGARWEQRTVRAIRDAAFFIPVLTPNFLQSEWCCREVRLFLERERQLADLYPALLHRSRIFPIHFVDTTDADAMDEGVRDTLMQLQHLNFQGLRYLNYDSEPRVRDEISTFVAAIRQLLRLRLDKPNEPAEADAPPRSGAAAPLPSPPPPPPPPPPPVTPHKPDAPPPAADARSRVPKPAIIGGIAALAVLVLIVALAGENQSYGGSSGGTYSSNEFADLDANLATDAISNASDMNAAADEIGNTTETDTNTVVPASGPARQIYFMNECNRPVELRLHYNVDGVWRDMRGDRWSFGANRSAYLDDLGVPVRATGEGFYIHARTTDGSGLVWSGTYPRTFAGQSYSTQYRVATVNSDGDFVLNITCTDQTQ